jgi:hypothetical protein
MKPPIFLWKSGTLDAFDSVEEIQDLYPPDAIVEDDVIACDCEGRILLAGRSSGGLVVFADYGQQPPSPDTLREILRGYLERSGTPPEELDSLSLEDLVAKVYPPHNARPERLSEKFSRIFVGFMRRLGSGTQVG